MRGDAEAGRLRARLQAAGALALALAIFLLDILSPLQGAVAVLYTIVVLLAARTHDRRLVAGAGLLGVVLAFAGYVVSHWSEPLGSPAMRLVVSLIAITITTQLSARREAADEQRRRSERRYRSIFDTAGFPIWEADWSAIHARLRAGAAAEDLIEFGERNARIIDLNQAALRLFGVEDRSELIGGTIFQYRTPASQETLGHILEALQDGVTSISEETQLRLPSGELVDVILRVTLPPDHDGWKRVLVMALDVTDRNRTQARLDQSQAELAHVSRVSLLGQLAASIAHEVNQPLSAIITYAKSGQRWLKREAPAAAEVADCLDHIASNGTRAADVIARIRDLARKAAPKQQSFALPALIDETIALLRRDLQLHDVVISSAIAVDLPPVLGDRVQLQQVLMNLMLNADQAMLGTPADRRELHLEASHDERGVTVEVRDRGPGIAGDPENLFSPFFTTRAEGMGMGLSICRSIIERHGGRLIAEGRADGGAVFRFSLPVELAEAEDAA